MDHATAILMIARPIAALIIMAAGIGARLECTLASDGARGDDTRFYIISTCQRCERFIIRLLFTVVSKDRLFH